MSLTSVISHNPLSGRHIERKHAGIFGGGSKLLLRQAAIVFRSECLTFDTYNPRSGASFVLLPTELLLTPVKCQLLSSPL